MPHPRHVKQIVHYRLSPFLYILEVYLVIEEIEATGQDTLTSTLPVAVRASISWPQAVRGLARWSSKDKVWSNAERL